MTTESPELLTVRAAAKLLGVDRHTVYRLIKEGRVPVVKLSPQIWRIPRWLLLQRMGELAEGLGQKGAEDDAGN